MGEAGVGDELLQVFLGQFTKVARALPVLLHPLFVACTVWRDLEIQYLADHLLNVFFSFVVPTINVTQKLQIH